MKPNATHIPFTMDGDAFRWQDLPVKSYDAPGSRSKWMSKQIVFEGSEILPMEVRYFEAEPGGYSALEVHGHAHFVTVLRGHGHVLLGDRIVAFSTNDTIYIPGETYHQFYAPANERLGFLCSVTVERDRPRRPDEAEIERLRENPEIREWLRY